MQAASLSLSTESSTSELPPQPSQFLSQFPLLLPNAFAVPDDTTTTFEFNPAQLYGDQTYITQYSDEYKEAFKAQFIFLIGQLEQWINQQNYTAAELQKESLNIRLAITHLNTDLFQPGYAEMQPADYFEKIKTNLE